MTTRQKKIRREIIKQQKQRPNRVSTEKSYLSLFYGALAVVLLGAIIFVGLRFLPPQSKRGIAQEQSILSQQTEQKTEKNQKKTYTVEIGDSLWSISQEFYQSGYNWVDIAKENKLENPSLITSGMVLVIPDTQAVVLAQAAVVPTVSINGGGQKIEVENYTVQHGDYLWDIAVRAYGDGFKWTEIAHANNLSDPNIIHAGNILKIPRQT